MRTHIGKRVEEGILLFIILLNILDFFEVLPGDFDYVKKIISWTVLGYVLYHAHLSEVFFGDKKGWFDSTLILTYFLFMVKELVGYAHATVEEMVHIKPFFVFLLENAQAIEMTGLMIGGCMLVLLALIAALKFSFQRPSLMTVWVEESFPSRKITTLFKRWTSIYLVLIAFFVIFFNLFMEWLAIAVDAPLLMTALLLYIFLALIRRRFSSEGLLFRIGSIGEDFYKRFIHLFERKETIFLGIAGMLVLHLVTDIANFIFPMLFGLHDALYLNQLGFAGRQTFYALFSEQIIGAVSVGEIISIAWIYVFNIVGILFLLLAPAVLWTHLFQEKQLHVKLVYVFIFYISLTCFLLAPVFTLHAIQNPNVLVGVNISNQTFTPLFGLSPIMVIALSFAVAFVVTLFSLRRKIKHIFVGIASLGIFGFFGWYIGLFFYDQVKYYLFAIPLVYAQGNWFVAFQFCLFLAVVVFLYVGGYGMTLWELYKEIRESD